MQTPETTSSGYLAGMSLRLLTGYRPELIATVLGLQPVPERSIVLAGARDLDPPEETYLASSPIMTCAVANLEAAVLPDGPLYRAGGGPVPGWPLITQAGVPRPRSTARSTGE